MAKASDLIGKSGSGGFQPPSKPAFQHIEKKKEVGDQGASKQAPARDMKSTKGGGQGGGVPTSVRPKV